MSFTEFDIVLCQKDDDNFTRVLDPLNADQFFREFTKLNDSADIPELVKKVTALVEPKIDFNTVNYLDALAILRDLGMIAGALVRHKVDLSDIPHIEEKLVKAGIIADEVPRDTVFSYGPRNPQGIRQRRFTGIHEEQFFINSFTDGMSHLCDCMVNLFQAREIKLDNTEYAPHIIKATESFRLMLSAIIDVRKNISPEVFTYKLRPFFDPVKVCGKEYLGPGGTQMPVILIDKLLWSGLIEVDYYQQYYSENLRYLPASYRRFGNIISGKRSLLDLFDNDQLSADSKIITVSLVSLLNFLTELVRFRAVHLQVARENFALREGSDVGSGGYRPDILEYLFKSVSDARLTLKNFLSTRLEV